MLLTGGIFSKSIFQSPYFLDLDFLGVNKFCLFLELIYFIYLVEGRKRPPRKRQGRNIKPASPRNASGRARAGY